MALLIAPLFTAGIVVGGFPNAMAGGEPPKTIVVDADGEVGHSNPRNTAQCDGTRISVGTSIQVAINSAAPGDTIIVCPGEYDEAVVVDVSDITVKGIALPVVDGSGVTGAAFTITADGVHLTGFDLHDDGDDCIRVLGASDVRIHGNIASGCIGDGIVVNADGNTISGNTVNQNDSQGIIINGNDNTIRGNTVNGNLDGNGIHILGNGNTIQGNIANGNASDGIELDSGSENNLVKANTANDNGIYGFNDDGGSGNDFIKNRCRDNGTAGSNTGDLCKPQG